MLRRNLIVLFVAIVGIFSIAHLSSAAKADGMVSATELADSCKNVSFSVVNGRSNQITIVKVKYYNANEGRWQTEDVSNTTCPSNHTCSFGNEDLRDSEGDRITKIVVVFHDANDSSEQASPTFVPSTPVCTANRSYGLRQNWAIRPGPTQGFGFENSGGGNNNGGAGNTNSNAGGSCKNVAFAFHNNRNHEIVIRRVKYFNKTENRSQVEDVPDTKCAPGAACRFGKEDLRDSAGDDITKLSFIFEDKVTNKLFESVNFSPDAPKCSDEKVFGLGQGWNTDGSTPAQSNMEQFNEKKAQVERDMGPTITDAINNPLGDCMGVTFEVHYNTAGAIAIPEVKYFNKSKNKWKTEQIYAPQARDNICYGDCWINESGKGSRLAGANGDDITKIIFVYQTSLDAGATRWSTKQESREFVPADPKCREGKKYGQGQRWTIGNAGGGQSQTTTQKNDDKAVPLIKRRFPIKKPN